MNALMKSRMTGLSGQVLERTPPTKLNTTAFSCPSLIIFRASCIDVYPVHTV